MVPAVNCLALFVTAAVYLTLQLVIATSCCTSSSLHKLCYSITMRASFLNDCPEFMWVEV